MVKPSLPSWEVVLYVQHIIMKASFQRSEFYSNWCFWVLFVFFFVFSALICCYVERFLCNLRRLLFMIVYFTFSTVNMPGTQQLVGTYLTILQQKIMIFCMIQTKNMLMLVMWCQKFVEQQTIKTKKRVLENITIYSLQKKGCMYLQQIIMKTSCPSSEFHFLISTVLLTYFLFASILFF